MTEITEEFDSYYRQIISYSKERVVGPKIIGLSELKNEPIYDIIAEAHKIIKKYKSGDIDYGIAQEDLLRLCALGYTIAEYTGLLKGGAKHNSSIRKGFVAEHSVTIREKNAEDRSSVGAPRLTDKDVSNLAEVASIELTQDIAVHESLSEIFYSVYQLIIHFTTMLNSILKRYHENDKLFNSPHSKLPYSN